MNAASPRHTSVRRWWAAALGAAVVTLAGCTTSGETSASTPAPTVSASPVATTAEACATVRSGFPCAAVSVDGRDYRYALTRRPNGPSAGERAVLVDLGGPGRSLFANADLLQFAAAWPGDERLLFVEEPWVLEEPTSACTRALSGFYSALHETTPPAAAAGELDDACDVTGGSRWGWSDRVYGAVVDRIVDAENLHLVGLVGSSYGATRAARLWDRPGLQWTILNSPSPLRMSGRDYLTARAAGALTALARGCPECPRGTAASVVARSARDLRAEPVELATRTPLVNDIDAAAAAVSLPYLAPAALREAAAALRRPVSGARTIGALSDSLLMRYGATDMSPGMLAYFQEVCRSYDPWTPPAGEGVVPKMLWALHAPCVAGAPATTPGNPPAPPPRVCIASAVDDAVTPAAFLGHWRALAPAAERVALPGAQHASPDGAAACYRAIT